MATVKSTTVTNYDAGSKLDVYQMSGRVRVSYGTYTCSATASGTVIEMCHLPKGARVIGAALAHGALGTGVTLNVGVESNTALLQAAGAAASAGTSFLVPAAGTGMTQVTADDGEDVVVTIGGAAATGTIDLTVFWVLD